jgi:hypothetical protein
MMESALTRPLEPARPARSALPSKTPKPAKAADAPRPAGRIRVGSGTRWG